MPRTRSWVALTLSARSRALHVSSPIGLGHAWRDVAIARELRAHRARGSRSTGSPSTPLTTLLEACGETVHPASAELAPEAAPRRRRGGRARAARVPDAAPARRDLLRELHGLRRPRARGALRRLDRRRGLGGRLLPAREPGAQDRAVRVDDRLRGRADDGRRRRARGVPGRRHQRADRRARGAQPAGPRLVDLHRRSRRRRRRGRLGPGLPEIREWTEAALPLHRLRHRLRPGGGRRPGRAPRRAGLRARREGLHRRRRAARASAPTCSQRVVAAFAEAKRRVPSCG